MSNPDNNDPDYKWRIFGAIVFLGLMYSSIAFTVASSRSQSAGSIAALHALGYVALTVLARIVLYRQSPTELGTKTAKTKQVQLLDMNNAAVWIIANVISGLLLQILAAQLVR